MRLATLVCVLTGSVLGLQKRDSDSTTPQRTTTTSSTSSSSRSRTDGTTTSISGLIPASITSNSITTRTLHPTPTYLKFMFSRSNSDAYYDIPVKLNGQTVPFRLDILQPDLWMLNSEQLLPCSEIASFADEHSSQLNWESIYLTYTEVRATACGKYLMFSSETSAPLATVSGIENGDLWSAAYVDRINATGVWTTVEDFVVDGINGVSLELLNVTMGDANSTNVVVGGFGLASDPQGSGFLLSLVDHGFINRSSYSLHFHEQKADLLPGVVDLSLFDGDFVAYDILPHEGAPGKDTTLVNRLKDITFPTVLLQDVSVRNTATNEVQSLMGSSGSSRDIPVILHTRSSYLYLPLDIIVNIAMQTNAVYVSELSNWIVGCDQINGSNAQLEFRFPDLTIKVPISAILSNAYDSNSNQVFFSDGTKACYLNVIDNTGTGLTSLGLPFLSQVYMAVDNVSGKVALGQAQHANSSDTDSDALALLTTIQTTDPYTTLTNTQKLFISTSTYAYIDDSLIPFASYYSASELSTLTYYQLNTLATLEIPAQFTSALFSLGSIYFSQSITTAAGSLTTLDASETTSENKTSNGADGLAGSWALSLASLLLSFLVM